MQRRKIVSSCESGFMLCFCTFASGIVSCCVFTHVYYSVCVCVCVCVCYSNTVFVYVSVALMTSREQTSSRFEKDIYFYLLSSVEPFAKILTKFILELSVSQHVCLSGRLRTFCSNILCAHKTSSASQILATILADSLKGKQGTDMSIFCWKQLPA